VQLLADRLIPKAEREKALLENSAPDLEAPSKIATKRNGASRASKTVKRATKRTAKKK